MGINFPPSPTIGTLWPNPATAGVPQYTWNGTVWTTVLAPPAFYTQDTAPVGAPVNALWWDTDSGILFINYKDVSTTQWVATSATPAVDTSGFATQTSRLRNRIVNGAMQISQEWGNTISGPTATINFHAADQWAVTSGTSPGTASIQRVQSRTPRGSTDRLRIVVAAAKTTLTAADYLHFYQPIEGYCVADFLYGTAQARQAIVRFGFKAPAGTYTFKVGNGANTRTYLTNFTITAGQANTDTEQVIVIPGDTQGVWATNEATGLIVDIVLAAGTNHHGASGWNTGFFLGTSSTSNGMAATNNTFELFDVGLYLDADNVGVPPKWELPAYDDELARCERYWQRPHFYTTGFQTGSGAASNWISHALRPTMRATPAVVTTGTAPTLFNCSYTLSTNNPREIILTITSTAAGHAYLQNLDIACNARM